MNDQEFVNNLYKMSRDKLLSGKLFTRLSSNESAKNMDGSNRDLYIIAGVVAAPKEMFLSEHLYTVAGMESSNGILMGIDTSFIRNISKVSTGNGIDGILTKPFWRI